MADFLSFPWVYRLDPWPKRNLAATNIEHFDLIPTIEHNLTISGLTHGRVRQPSPAKRPGTRRSRGGQQRVGQRHREGQVLGPELLGRAWSPGAAEPRRWRLCNAKKRGL